MSLTFPSTSAQSSYFPPSVPFRNQSKSLILNRPSPQNKKNLRESRKDTNETERTKQLETGKDSKYSNEHSLVWDNVTESQRQNGTVQNRATYDFPHSLQLRFENLDVMLTDMPSCVYPS